MNKKEFIKIFQDNLLELNNDPNKKHQFDFNVSETTELTNVFLKSLEDSFQKDNKLSFVGFGTFEVKTTVERIGRNPKTGEEIKIKPRKVVKFRNGNSLDKKLNSNLVENLYKKD